MGKKSADEANDSRSSGPTSEQWFDEIANKFFKLVGEVVGFGSLEWKLFAKTPEKDVVDWVRGIKAAGLVLSKYKDALIEDNQHRDGKTVNNMEGLLIKAAVEAAIAFQKARSEEGGTHSQTWAQKAAAGNNAQPQQKRGHQKNSNSSNDAGGRQGNGYRGRSERAEFLRKQIEHRRSEGNCFSMGVSGTAHMRWHDVRHEVDKILTPMDTAKLKPYYQWKPEYIRIDVQDATVGRKIYEAMHTKMLKPQGGGKESKLNFCWFKDGKEEMKYGEPPASWTVQATEQEPAPTQKQQSEDKRKADGKDTTKQTNTTSKGTREPTTPQKRQGRERTATPDVTTRKKRTKTKATGDIGLLATNNTFDALRTLSEDEGDEGPRVSETKVSEDEGRTSQPTSKDVGLGSSF